MKRFVSTIVLCLAAFVEAASSTPADYSELDKLIPAELVEKNTPGAVITVMRTRSCLFQGRAGAFQFLFTELYGAKKIK